MGRQGKAVSKKPPCPPSQIQSSAHELWLKTRVGKEIELISEHDDEMIRCPRVGGYVSFKLCRSENGLLPCRWIIDCWENRLEIERFLDEQFSAEDLTRIFVPPKPKLEGLVEMIEKVKKAKGSAGNH
jgi:hypothetical protein